MVTTIVTIIVIVILARTCGANFGRKLAEERIADRAEQYKTSESSINVVENSLAEIVRLASPGLPKMVDRITRLDSVSTQNGNTIIESYTITTLAKSDIDIPTLTSDLNHTKKSQYRSDPNLKLLRDHNIVWIWKYYDKNGELIATVNSSL